MKKKLHSLLLALCLVLGLVACTKGPAWQEQYDLGVRYLSEGNYQEAIIAFTAAIEIDPKQENAYIGLADAYIGTGDYEQARQVLQTAQKQIGNLQKVEDKLADLEEWAKWPKDDEIVHLKPDGTSASEQGLSVHTSNRRSATITIEGIDIQESYTANPNEVNDYYWVVCMHTEQQEYSVSTTYAVDRVRDNKIRIDEMRHNLNVLYEDGSAETIGSVDMNYTVDSISWSFSVPEEYAFDLTAVKQYEVGISDKTNNSGWKTYTVSNAQ